MTKAIIGIFLAVGVLIVLAELTFDLPDADPRNLWVAAFAFAIAGVVWWYTKRRRGGGGPTT